MGKYGDYDNPRLDTLKDKVVEKVDLAYQAGANDAYEDISNKLNGLRAQLTKANERMIQSRADYDSASKGCSMLRDKVNMAKATIATLTAERDTARAALRPFAKEQDEWLAVIKRAPGCSLMAGWMVACIKAAAALCDGDKGDGGDEKETG